MRPKKLKTLYPTIEIVGEELLPKMSPKTFNRLLSSLKNKEYQNFDSVVIGDAFRYSFDEFEDFCYLEIRWGDVYEHKIQ